MLRGIMVGFVGVVVLGLPAGALAEGGCVNEAVRRQQGYALRLANCRAYELVTPVEKGDGTLSASGPVGVHSFYEQPAPYGGGSFQASESGDGLAFASFTPFPGALAGAVEYIAARGGDGWSSQSITPRQASPGGPNTSHVAAYSLDLAKAAFEDGGVAKGQDSPPLVPGEPQNNQNLFLRDDATSTYQLMDLTPAGVAPAGAVFEGASADFSHVLFISQAPLTPDAPNGMASLSDNLFEWVGGVVTLAGLVPMPPATRCGGGGPACSAPVEGAALGAGDFNTAPAGFLNAVSPDGSKVFFKGAGGTRYAQLYMRENGLTTVEVSASQKTNGSGPGGRDPAGPRFPRYWPASADGSKAFFTSCEQLTNDSTANASKSEEACIGSIGSGDRWSGSDLYRYDTASGVLSDLTVDHNGDPLGADVQAVFGASADGSYVYFVANGVLASGASLGNCHGLGENGQCNLYVAHNGTTSFIARIEGVGSYGSWSLYATAARATSDGTRLAFETPRSLTGYDNRDAVTGEPDSEVYLYDATSSQLVCVSCNPSGTRPLGSSHLTTIEGPPSGPSGAGNSLTFEYLPRNLSSDGVRLFFDSSDALVPGDVNGAQDVYEDEGGSLHLVSRGTNKEASMFMDASSSGNDVLFTTRSQLVGQDIDQRVDIYDARVGGGFPFAAPLPGCVGEACKAPPSGPPATSLLGSSALVGMGNLTLAPAAAVVVGRGVTRARKLAVALRVCRRKPKRLRASCVGRAHRLYGPARTARKSTMSVRGAK